MKKLLFAVLFPIVIFGYCILEAVDCQWIPPDARWEESITKMLWVTNIGDEVCDSTNLQLALAAWGLWLNWEDAESYPLPFVCPGDTVLIAMQEMRACNEEYYRDVDWLNPIFVDHYDFVEAPADSGVCDTFYIGNPTTGTITVNVTIDSVTGTDWDVTVSPIMFSLAAGDSQAIAICAGFIGWDDSDTLWGDSSFWGGCGELSFVSAGATDTTRAPIDMGDAILRHGRYRSYTCVTTRLPYLYQGFVSLDQVVDINGAYSPYYKNMIIRMNNSTPFEHNIDLSTYWYGSRFENSSFRATTPECPYMVTYPSYARLLHSSFTDASGMGDSDAALNIEGSFEFYAKQLLVQNTHDSYAINLESPFHIEGLVIKDAGGGLKIFNDGVIEDFTFEDIAGYAVDIIGEIDVDVIASQVEPEDVRITGRGTVSLYSRGRILVEDTLGEKLDGVMVNVLWGTELIHYGATNIYGSFDPFPIKWAEIGLDTVVENKNVRFTLTLPGYRDIDTTIAIGGVKDWIRFTMYPNTGISEELPEEFEISVEPNPFNGSVGIVSPENCELEIFDIEGRSVAKLPGGSRVWTPDKSVGSGVYLIRARSGDMEVTKKVEYLK